MSEARHGFVELAENCFVGTLETASNCVVERACQQMGGYVCLCNVHVLTLARREQWLRDVLSSAWMLLPDGAPVAWLERRVGLDGAQRVGGPDLMARVLELGQSVGLRHFFLGSTPMVLRKLEHRVRTMLPGVEIAGSLSPPFGPLGADVVSAISDELRATRPDIVWVGLGAPKQEFWLRRFALEVPFALLLGVGAAFDFLAGTKPRAPVWMRGSGLEWLYRLLQEPTRLSGRYIRTNTDFVIGTTIELSRRKLGFIAVPGGRRRI